MIKKNKQATGNRRTTGLNGCVITKPPWIRAELLQGSLERTCLPLSLTQNESSVFAQSTREAKLYVTLLKNIKFQKIATRNLPS